MQVIQLESGVSILRAVRPRDSTRERMVACVASMTEVDAALPGMGGVRTPQEADWNALQSHTLEELGGGGRGNTEGRKRKWISLFESTETFHEDTSLQRQILFLHDKNCEDQLSMQVAEDAVESKTVTAPETAEELHKRLQLPRMSALCSFPEEAQALRDFTESLSEQGLLRLMDRCRYVPCTLYARLLWRLYFMKREQVCSEADAGVSRPLSMSVTNGPDISQFGKPAAGAAKETGEASRSFLLLPELGEGEEGEEGEEGKGAEDEERFESAILLPQRALEEQHRNGLFTLDFDHGVLVYDALEELALCCGGGGDAGGKRWRPLELFEARLEAMRKDEGSKALVRKVFSYGDPVLAPLDARELSQMRRWFRDVISLRALHAFVYALQFASRAMTRLHRERPTWSQVRARGLTAPPEPTVGRLFEIYGELYRVWCADTKQRLDRVRASRQHREEKADRSAHADETRQQLRDQLKRARLQRTSHHAITVRARKQG